MTDQWERFRILTTQIGLERDYRQDLLNNLRELERNAMFANLSGLVAVAANTVIIPLNVIVNAAPAGGKAKTIAQRIGKALYEQYGSSGSRVQSDSGKLLGVFKDAALGEMARRGATDWIPAAKVLTGLAEDSLALLETLQMTSKGSSGMRNARELQDAALRKVKERILYLTSQQSHVLKGFQVRARTA